MASDLRPGPDSPPTDELASAERALAVLQQVLHPIGDGDLFRPTPCPEYDVSGLTGHLLNSIVVLGGMAGAEFTMRDHTSTPEGQVVSAARPALDAWHRRGMDGDVPLGPASMPARVAVSVFSIEFLVHAWDYATAVGHDIHVPDLLADYVLGLAQNLIQPHERGAAGFDDPVQVGDDVRGLHRLVAFTGRNPIR
ncbi:MULTISPECIES: TIGR03086 family metal-binding protein [Mycobacterium]|uniref:TIGR03086 family protein n=1 Tax=Mycobacterium pseudoshottsii TaxID=265949 RepID=A0A9N7LXD3_9MYCO|nr:MULTISPECIES: TIGR03086 family metal-binding protein [Mycobacterium]RFZ65688.1 hypothetical protein DL240490_02217 [Mycobacterium marinum]BBA90684.1 TIGR03086 family protein [Mycobacterium pseudoshottsii JCM 15466]BDN85186.1 TIGR03086 family protein [Mycobacterium pseudoshottsii]BEH79561.1 TIGR03086 family protein [Mycobacterium pseudoshottsii]